jgi:hypothetical protein
MSLISSIFAAMSDAMPTGLYHIIIPTMAVITASREVNRSASGFAFSPIEPITRPIAMKKMIRPGNGAHNSV